MTNLDPKALQEELDHYREEREKIRALIGEIGGAGFSKRDRAINLVFIGLVAILFAWDICLHFGVLPESFRSALPPLISLETAILLVSVKIIWMMHQQARVEHFQFWILNSIEFRLNEMAKRFRTIEKALKKDDESS